jgi:hypothetical protein
MIYNLMKINLKFRKIQYKLIWSVLIFLKDQTNPIRPIWLQLLTVGHALNFDIMQQQELRDCECEQYSNNHFFFTINHIYATDPCV